MIDYHVELIRFPSGKTHEAVTINEDGSATIFINKNNCKEIQRKRFLHAVKHLRENDFCKDIVRMMMVQTRTIVRVKNVKNPHKH